MIRFIQTLSKSNMPIIGKFRSGNPERTKETKEKVKKQVTPQILTPLERLEETEDAIVLEKVINYLRSIKSSQDEIKQEIIQKIIDLYEQFRASEKFWESISSREARVLGEGIKQVINENYPTIRISANPVRSDEELKNVVEKANKYSDEINKKIDQFLRKKIEKKQREIEKITSKLGNVDPNNPRQKKKIKRLEAQLEKKKKEIDQFKTQNNEELQMKISNRLDQSTRRQVPPREIVRLAKNHFRYQEKRARTTSPSVPGDEYNNPILKWGAKLLRHPSLQQQDPLDSNTFFSNTMRSFGTAASRSLGVVGHGLKTAWKALKELYKHEVKNS